MALRALLFSKSPETTDALTAVLQEAGIRAELCTDIFAAMEKGTKQPFSSVIVDWSEQPEAGFLLKRARESGVNRTATVIAIVGDDPTPEEEREHRLDFLIYRPIVADEARAVLAKACQQMQVHGTAYAGDAGALDRPEISEPVEPASEEPDLVSIASELPDTNLLANTEEQGEQSVYDDSRDRGSSSPLKFKSALAAALVLAAVFFFWRSRDAFQYLNHTPEGTKRVLQESVAALFFADKSGTQSVGTAMTDSQQDAYFTRTPSNGNSSPSNLGVVASDINFSDAPMRLPPPFDFPLPTPELHVDPVAARPHRSAVPDSIRASAPVARPVSMTVNPAQMMPVSTPPPPASWQQTGEPIQLSEPAARALMLQSVNPVYPPEALPQKLQGAVVLQVAIGRDGSVQELKLVRGYFVLAKAAIAAVKQWRFKPSVSGGHPVEAQTVITVNFGYPPS